MYSIYIVLHKAAAPGSSGAPVFLLMTLVMIGLAIFLIFRGKNKKRPQETSTDSSKAFFYDNGGFTLTHYLFSFRGRLSRAGFWVYQLASIVFFIAILFMADFSRSYEPDYVTVPAPPPGPSAFVVLFMLMFYVFFVWTSLAVQVKRWHDLNKPGYWVFLNLVPFGFIWIIIEQGFFVGTRGDNLYGPDPLSRK